MRRCRGERETQGGPSAVHVAEEKAGGRKFCGHTDRRQLEVVIASGDRSHYEGMRRFTIICGVFCHLRRLKWGGVAPRWGRCILRIRLWPVRLTDDNYFELTCLRLIFKFQTDQIDNIGPCQWLLVLKLKFGESSCPRDPPHAPDEADGQLEDLKCPGSLEMSNVQNPQHHQCIAIFV